MPKRPPLNVTFLTGTRAEFGLMAPTLRAIQSHPKLHLSLLATGMHLDPTHGNSLHEIKRQGFKVDATIPWPPSPQPPPPSLTVSRCPPPRLPRGILRSLAFVNGDDPRRGLSESAPAPGRHRPRHDNRERH